MMSVKPSRAQQKNYRNIRLEKPHSLFFLGLMNSSVALVPRKLPVIDGEHE